MLPHFTLQPILDGEYFYLYVTNEKKWAFQVTAREAETDLTASQIHAFNHHITWLLLNPCKVQQMTVLEKSPDVPVQNK